MGKQPELAACNELPKSMQEWKEAIEKGAAAAVDGRIVEHRAA